MTHPNMDLRYVQCDGCRSWQSKAYRTCPKCGTALRIVPISGALYGIKAPATCRRSIRGVVLSILSLSGRWMTYAELYRAVEAETGPRSESTMYRTLRKMTADGEICVERHECNRYHIADPPSNRNCI